MVISPTRTSSARRSPARRLADRRLFFAETFRTFRTTGAVTPSGRHLATALAAPLAHRTGQPRAVLEVGAGTGAVSRVLADLLGPEDTLDLVEANPRFARLLAADLCADPRLAVHRERIALIAGPVAELDPQARYDVIVSGLPFANFHPREVSGLLAGYLTALKPGGHLTYFGYRGTARLRALLGTSRSLAQHSGVTHVLDTFQQTHAADCRTVWGNLPPARVWHLRAPTKTSRSTPVPHCLGQGRAGERLRGCRRVSLWPLPDRIRCWSSAPRMSALLHRQGCMASTTGH